MPDNARSCPFCEIVRGAGEVSLCYEDATVIAFMDIQPVNAGHVLVVPREHHERIDDLPRDVGLHVYRVATQLIPIIQQVSGTLSVKGQQHPIENGRLRGDELSFTANGVGYTGHVNGNVIEGQTANGAWRASRTATGAAPAPAR